jgi:choline dehydrogenase
VLTQAQVQHLIFEKNRAVGVAYYQNGSGQQARANREVILCGGAINSPQLLLLSGIGPANDLRARELPVVLDLPGVGQNLQDHPAVAVSYQCTQPISLANAEKIGHILNFVLFNKGPLTSNIAETGGFLKTQSNLAAPDLQFHFAPVYFIEHGFGNPAGHGFTFGPTLLHPQSRGRITLRSKRPSDPPLIQANYLAEEADRRVLMEGVKLSRELAHTKAFDSFRGEEAFPGPHTRSAEAMAEYVRNNVQTLYHPVGTCKMGKDALAVVDEELRVYGIEGLRVADASIMPTIVGGNTNAPTIMIAEKVAALIKSGASSSTGTATTIGSEQTTRL